jgi:hypothetical protein
MPDWTAHLQKGKVELLDHDQVHKFLRVHFLHWLEAMSLTGQISEAIVAIINLAARVDVSQIFDLGMQLLMAAISRRALQASTTSYMIAIDSSWPFGTSSRMHPDNYIKVASSSVC